MLTITNGFTYIAFLMLLAGEVEYLQHRSAARMDLHLQHVLLHHRSLQFR